MSARRGLTAAGLLCSATALAVLYSTGVADGAGVFLAAGLAMIGAVLATEGFPR